MWWKPCHSSIKQSTQQSGETKSYKMEEPKFWQMKNPQRRMDCAEGTGTN